MKKNNYNLDKLKQLAEDNTTFIQEMVSVFLKELPEDLNNLNTAITSGNRLMASEYANKIKPTVDLFSVDCLTDLQIIIEWSNSNDPLDISSYLHNVNEQINAVIVQLKEDF